MNQLPKSQSLHITPKTKPSNPAMLSHPFRGTFRWGETFGKERTDASTSRRGESPKALSQRALCPSSQAGQIFKRKDPVCKAQAHEPQAEIPAGLFGFAGVGTRVNLEQSSRMLFFLQHFKALHGRAQRRWQRVMGLCRILHLGKGGSKFSQDSHRVVTTWFCPVVILFSWNTLWLITKDS